MEVQNHWNQRPYLHDVILGKVGGSNWWLAYGTTMGIACFLTTLPQNGVLKAVKLMVTSGLTLFAADWLNRRRAESLLPQKVRLLTKELEERAALIDSYITPREGDDRAAIKAQLAALGDWQQLLVHQPLEVYNLLERGVFKVSQMDWSANKATAADLPRLCLKPEPDISELRLCHRELQRIITMIGEHVVLEGDGETWEPEQMNQQRSDDAVVRDVMIMAAFFAPVIFWVAT